MHFVFAHPMEVIAKGDFSGQPVTGVRRILTRIKAHHYERTSILSRLSARRKLQSSDLTIHPQMGIWTNTILVPRTLYSW